MVGRFEFLRISSKIHCLLHVEPVGNPSPFGMLKYTSSGTSKTTQMVGHRGSLTPFTKIDPKMDLGIAKWGREGDEEMTCTCAARHGRHGRHHVNMTRHSGHFARHFGAKMASGVTHA